MRVVQQSSRWSSRLWVVLLLLAGLVGMHGLVTSAGHHHPRDLPAAAGIAHDSTAIAGADDHSSSTVAIGDDHTALVGPLLHRAPAPDDHPPCEEGCFHTGRACLAVLLLGGVLLLLVRSARHAPIPRTGRPPAISRRLLAGNALSMPDLFLDRLVILRV